MASRKSTRVKAPAIRAGSSSSGTSDLDDCATLNSELHEFHGLERVEHEEEDNSSSPNEVQQGIVGRVDNKRNYVTTKLAEVPLRHKCEGCQAIFKSVRLLDDHLRSNLSCSGFLECDICHKGYRSKQGLKVHLKLSKCAQVIQQVKEKKSAEN